MSANVAFPAGQGGANACSTTGSLGQNDWAHYNANNQMDPATKSYDQAGNMVGDNSTGNSYLYDGDGNRIAKGSLTSLSCNFSTNGFALQTSWVRNVGNQEGEWSGSASWMHTNVYDGSSLLATYSSANNDTYFALNDWLGTKRAEVAADGSCLSTFASLPYGDDLTQAGDCSDATEQHFTGKERDAESGNDYFGARYYASSMGRMMSPDYSDSDPVPVPSADFENPQSLNLYSYVHDDPLTNTDPDGHDCVNGSNASNGSISVQTTSDSSACLSGYTYVNGTVDPNSVTYSNGQLGFNISNYADGSGIAASVTMASGSQLDPDTLKAGVFGSPSAQTWTNANGAVTDATIFVAATAGSVGLAIAGTEIAAGTAAARSGIIFRLAHGMRVALGHSQVLAEQSAVKNAIATAIASGAFQKAGNVISGIVNVAGTYIRFTGYQQPGGQTIISNVMGQALQR